jgi:hypothetical protein
MHAPVLETTFLDTCVSLLETLVCKKAKYSKLCVVTLLLCSWNQFHDAINLVFCFCFLIFLC